MDFQSLNIEASENTPEVRLNAQTHVFEFAKSSHPPNVQDFYSPIFEWLNQYELHVIKNGDVSEIKLNFMFDYLNTASMKYVVEFLLRLKKVEQYKITLVINWYHKEIDEQMREDGEDLSYAVDLPFNILSY